MLVGGTYVRIGIAAPNQASISALGLKSGLNPQHLKVVFGNERQTTGHKVERF